MNCIRVSSSPVPVDDDLGRAGDVEVGGLLRFGERLLVELVCTVHVSPRQQQVLNLHLRSLLPVLRPRGVVEVSTLFIFPPLLFAWSIRGT